MASAHQSTSPARVLGASLIGTAIEFYDFYIYATAASLIFGPLFFPASSPGVQLLAAYASFSVAFVARPLGGIIFGHFGDRVGRKATLVASLLLMGGSTFLIAFLPDYRTMGWWAPAALCLLRFGQGLGLGGEWGGASLLAVENAPPGWRARYGMFPPLGAPLGFILANGLFLALERSLSATAFESWGWRIPFLASALLVLVGLWIRARLGETERFAAARAANAQRPASVPLVAMWQTQRRAVIGGSVTAIACFAIFYLVTVFALGHATTTLGIARSTFLAVQIGAILFLAAGIVAAGFAADATSPRKVLMAGCLIGLPVALSFGFVLGSGSLAAIFVMLSMALFAMGLVYGPLGSFLPGLFPVPVRYTGVSITFNVGGIIGGALTPFAAQAAASAGGLPWVGVTLAAALLISFTALRWLPDESAA